MMDEKTSTLEPWSMTALGMVKEQISVSEEPKGRYFGHFFPEKTIHSLCECATNIKVYQAMVPNNI